MSNVADKKGLEANSVQRERTREKQGELGAYQVIDRLIFRRYRPSTPAQARQCDHTELRRCPEPAVHHGHVWVDLGPSGLSAFGQESANSVSRSNLARAVVRWTSKSDRTCENSRIILDP